MRAFHPGIEWSIDRTVDGRTYLQSRVLKFGTDAYCELENRIHGELDWSKEEFRMLVEKQGVRHLAKCEEDSRRASQAVLSAESEADLALQALYGVIRSVPRS